MLCFTLSFFRKCSDGNAARKEHGADIIYSNFSARGISVTSLPLKILSCELLSWHTSFVPSRLDQNPSTVERMPAIQAAAWLHGLKDAPSSNCVNYSPLPPPELRKMSAFAIFLWSKKKTYASFGVHPGENFKPGFEAGQNTRIQEGNGRAPVVVVVCLSFNKACWTNKVE
jgi:hypothetical protein